MTLIRDGIFGPCDDQHTPCLPVCLHGQANHMLESVEARSLEIIIPFMILRILQMEPPAMGQCLPGNRVLLGPHRKILEVLFHEFRREPAARPVVDHAVLVPPQHAEPRIADLDGAACDPVENGLQIVRRLRNHPQHVRACGLARQGALRVFEHPRVLDRDHRLIGKAFQHFHFALQKRRFALIGVGACQMQCTNGFALPHHRSNQCSIVADLFCNIPDNFIGRKPFKSILDIDKFAGLNGTVDDCLRDWQRLVSFGARSSDGAVYRAQMDQIVGLNRQDRHIRAGNDTLATF